MRLINADNLITAIKEKQKELCPVGKYGRNYVYGTDREKYDAWDEIIDVIENLLTNEGTTETNPSTNALNKINDLIDNTVCQKTESYSSHKKTYKTK